MAFPPRQPFIKYACDKCGWSLVVCQTSDARPRPHCASCGNTDLRQTPASALESLAADPRHYLGNLLRRR